MPKKRFSQGDIIELVSQKIQAAGGSIRHNDLLAALEAENAGELMQQVVRLATPGANTDLQASVQTVADGKGTLVYSLRSAAPVASVAPVQPVRTSAAPVNPAAAAPKAGE